MRGVQFIVLLATVLAVVSVVLLTRVSLRKSDSSPDSSSEDVRSISLARLGALLHEHNQSLHVLHAQIINSNANLVNAPCPDPTCPTCPTPLDCPRCAQQAPCKCPQANPASRSSTEHDPYQMFGLNPTQRDSECEQRFGLKLLETWAQKREEWCSPSQKAPISSSLHCYPFQQQHRRAKGVQADVFCEGKNIFIDFSKVKGIHGDRKPAIGAQYHSFEKGSIFAPCERTPNYNSRNFMPHHSLQMATFISGPDVSLPANYKTVSTPTYLLARDEDCENAFHSTADHMNMFLVMNAVKLNPQDAQLVLFDKHPNGPFFELYQKAYSPSHQVLRAADFKGETVLFERLVFHLESPAGIIFPGVTAPEPLRCKDSSYYRAFQQFVLQAFDLWHVDPPPIPSVVLSLRKRSASKNVGRVLANEEEVVNVLKTGNMMNLKVVDMGSMSFGEQLKLIRHCNVLVGVHGAGHMHIMYSAQESVLVEIHPSYRLDRHFRFAARMAGKIYLPMRASQRETCQGSSDNVKVPIEEFQRTMDGALRLARSFDDGLSECGLVCPAGILALDSRLNQFYGSTNTRKGDPYNTKFPC